MRAEWEIDPPRPSSCTIWRETKGALVGFSTLGAFARSFLLRLVVLDVVRLREIGLGNSSTGEVCGPEVMSEDGTPVAVTFS